MIQRTANDAQRPPGRHPGQRLISLRWALLGTAAASLVLLLSVVVPQRPPNPPAVTNQDGSVLGGQHEFAVRPYEEIVGGGVMTASGAEPGPDIGLDLVVKLGLVLALIYGGALALRRFGMGAAGTALAKRQIRILETQALGPQRSLVLVEVGDRRLLLGATPQQIQLLTEIVPSVASGATQLGESDTVAPRPGIQGEPDQDSRNVPASVPHRIRRATERLDAMTGRLRHG